jgi:hypothetical protein
MPSATPRRPERPTKPVEHVYQQSRPTISAPPDSAPPAARRVPAAGPAVDIERLDKELWKRFERRVRIERERHGRA